MYIHPFIAGVIFTVLAEILLVIVAVIISNRKESKKK